MEQWKVIKNYDNYLISNFGRIMKKDTGKQLKISINSLNRCVVNLCKDDLFKSLQISRLVASAFIDNVENKPCVDHINGDKNNNHYENLRWATHSENSMNSKKKICNTSSKYKGVFKNKNNKWCVTISNNKKQIYIGSYNDEIAAAEKYNEMARFYYKEFARLNIIDN